MCIKEKKAKANVIMYVQRIHGALSHTKGLYTLVTYPASDTVSCVGEVNEPSFCFMMCDV